MEMCGSDRYTCLVDGDTIWIEGNKLRLEHFDTPEPHTNICGGQAEIDLANKASARLLELLNSKDWTLDRSGRFDRYQRELVTIRVEGMSVGDILVQERLARYWPDGDEWWCSD